MPVNETVVDSVTIDDAKCVAGQHNSLANIALADTVNLARGMNQLMLKHLAVSLQQADIYSALSADYLLNKSPTDAASIQEILSGNALAEKLSALGAAIAGLQEMVKGAGTTPPVTVESSTQ
jgi:hypothetical protein